MILEGSHFNVAISIELHDRQAHPIIVDQVIDFS